MSEKLIRGTDLFPPPPAAVQASVSQSEVLLATMVMMAPMFLITCLATAIAMRGGKIGIMISIPLYIFAGMVLFGSFVQNSPSLVHGFLGALLGLLAGSLLGFFLRKWRLVPSQ
jgi:hypothetical protein